MEDEKQVIDRVAAMLEHGAYVGQRVQLIRAVPIGGEIIELTATGARIRIRHDFTGALIKTYDIHVMHGYFESTSR